MCWRHALSQSAAIHFHDDDIVDCEWGITRSFAVPEDMPSGVYVMQVSDGNPARPDWQPGGQKRGSEWNAYADNPAQYSGYIAFGEPDCS